MPVDPQLPDKQQLRRAFCGAASSYDAVAVLQREVGQRMLERLDYVRLQPAVVLDLGCGTGKLTAALAKRYRSAKVVAMDIAEPMLQRARRRVPWFRKWHFACGDAEQLPLADNCCDLVYSNLTLQWCGDLDRVFGELRRVVRPGGLVMFSTFGPDTLMELRQSWAQADAAHVHVNRFIDMHDIGDALLRAGLSDPVMDAEQMTLTYDDVFGLMRDLKNIGAHNVNAGRSRSLTGKGRLRALVDAYEAFRVQGKLPASYEVVYGHAWCVEPRTEAELPLSEFGRL